MGNRINNNVYGLPKPSFEEQDLITDYSDVTQRTGRNSAGPPYPKNLLDLTRESTVDPQTGLYRRPPSQYIQGEPMQIQGRVPQQVGPPQTQSTGVPGDSGPPGLPMQPDIPPVPADVPPYNYDGKMYTRQADVPSTLPSDPKVEKKRAGALEILANGENDLDTGLQQRSPNLGTSLRAMDPTALYNRSPSDLDPDENGLSDSGRAQFREKEQTKTKELLPEDIVTELQRRVKNLPSMKEMVKGRDTLGTAIRRDYLDMAKGGGADLSALQKMFASSAAITRASAGLDQSGRQRQALMDGLLPQDTSQKKREELTKRLRIWSELSRDISKAEDRAMGTMLGNTTTNDQLRDFIESRGGTWGGSGKAQAGIPGYNNITPRQAKAASDFIAKGGVERELFSTFGKISKILNKYKDEDTPGFLLGGLFKNPLTLGQTEDAKDINEAIKNLSSMKVKELSGVTARPDELKRFLDSIGGGKFAGPVQFRKNMRRVLKDLQLNSKLKYETFKFGYPEGYGEVVAKGSYPELYNSYQGINSDYARPVTTDKTRKQSGGPKKSTGDKELDEFLGRFGK